MDEIDDEIRRMFTVDPSTCACDFCTGKKRWEDNWCARCGEVQMAPPKWWENCDVCDACEKAVEIELAEEQAATSPVQREDC